MTSRVEIELKKLVNPRAKIPIDQISEGFLQIVQDCMDFEGFPITTFSDYLARFCIRNLPLCRSEQLLANLRQIIELLARNKVTKRPLLTSNCVVPSLIKALSHPDMSLTFKKEVLAMLIAIGTMSISPECRAGVRKKHSEEFDLLASQLFNIGEYDAQVLILEIFIRFHGHVDLQATSKWFKSEEIARMFCNFEPRAFEPMCRPLLNKLNQGCGNNSLVRSFACIKMNVGERQFVKPPDPHYDNLWVDFNFIPQSIWVFCQKPKNAPDLGKWDSLVMESSDILRYDIVNRGPNNVLRIELVKEAYMFLDSSKLSQFPGFILEMAFPKICPIEEAMKKICEKCPESGFESDDMIASSQPPTKGSCSMRFPCNAAEPFKESFMEEIGLQVAEQ